VHHVLHGLPFYGIPIPTFRFVEHIAGLLHDSRLADSDSMDNQQFYSNIVLFHLHQVSSATFSSWQRFFGFLLSAGNYI